MRSMRFATTRKWCAAAYTSSWRTNSARRKSSATSPRASSRSCCGGSDLPEPVHRNAEPPSVFLNCFDGSAIAENDLLLTIEFVHRFLELGAQARLLGGV